MSLPARVTRCWPRSMIRSSTWYPVDAGPVAADGLFSILGATLRVGAHCARSSPDRTPERAPPRCRRPATPTRPDRPGGCAFDPHLLFMAVTVDSLFLPPYTEVSSGLLTLATASAIAAW